MSNTPPIPQRKPDLDTGILGSALDLFSIPFGGGLPSVSASSSATSTAWNASTFNSGAFSVAGRDSSAAQGTPLLNSTTLIILTLVIGGIYLAGRK